MYRSNALKNEECIDFGADTKKRTSLMKFIIISNFKTQAYRNNLLLFSLDNPEEY